MLKRRKKLELNRIADKEGESKRVRVKTTTKNDERKKT